MKPIKNNKAPKGPKPVTKTLSFVATGVTAKGEEYNVDSCKAIMADLQAANCFDKLSVSAGINRARLVADGKGTAFIARITKYDVETGNVDLLLFGKNAEYADLLTDEMVVIPHVRTARGSADVTTISSFEIVPVMEA